MSADNNRVRQIFIDAVARVAPDEWDAYLIASCNGDEELRGRVKQLLRAHVEAGTFLEALSPISVLKEDSHGPEGPGSVIDTYKLLQQIGEGGMGAVYMAEQEQPVRRRVALKVIKPGMDSRQVIARFEAERQALALMDHYNIARVFDAGTTSSGRPYFVMELVHGVPITKYCDDNHLTPRERLALFVPVCAALQHAHQKGIIHRDLKPSNVMITLYDGKPVPKVIDFGVAKATEQRLTDRTLFTEYGTIIGTFEYMAPEQAEMSALGVDTRSDIYSLGVLLYELLTGSTPLEPKRLREAGFSEALRLIREEEPPKPSTRISTCVSLPTVAAARKTEPAKLSRLVRGELDWVVMKCLEKDRSRRYESAGSLARDIERFLRDEPVEACPPSTVYRARKFLCRHKTATSSAVCMFLLIVAGAGISTWQAIVAYQAEKDARQAWQKALNNETKALAAAEAEAAQRHQAEGVAELLESVFQDMNPKAAYEDLKGHLLKQIGNVTTKLESDQSSEPRARARLLNTLGLAFLNLGDAEKASVLLLHSLEQRREVLGPDDPDTLISLNNLALAYQAIGQYGKALPMFRECLEKRQAVLGADDELTLTSMNNLALVLRDTGECQKAIDLFEKALAKQRIHPGPTHEYTLTTMNNLALAYQDNLQYQLARALFEETLALRRKHIGQDHPDTLSSMNNLASALRFAEQYGQAIALFEEAFNKRKAILGADHPNTINTLNNLAWAHASAGQYAKATPLYELAYQKRIARLGQDHPATLNTMASLADTYRVLGRLEQGVPLAEQAYSKCQTALGKDHPQTLTAMRYLGMAYLDSKQESKGLALLQDLIVLQRARQGNNPSRLATCLDTVGEVLLQHRHFVKAETILQEALTLRQKILPESTTLYGTMMQLGECLLRQNRMPEAEAMLLGSYAGIKQQPAHSAAAQHSRMTKAMEKLVLLYDTWGKKAEAAKWRDELEARQEDQDFEDPN